ncbi:MAG: hypothetical protein M3468_13475 [Acidobacteriota bacterium]|nr:hypothetical protein [Acidobacteriota bacterium]
MSLRTRLVLAFFALSVVPMAAVTYYSYTTNVEALRVAAQREADLLAGELGQRMQLVTAQLSERVGHLMDLAEVQAAAGPVGRSSPAHRARNGGLPRNVGAAGRCDADDGEGGIKADGA